MAEYKPKFLLEISIKFHWKMFYTFRSDVKKSLIGKIFDQT